MKKHTKLKYYIYIYKRYSCFDATTGINQTIKKIKQAKKIGDEDQLRYKNTLKLLKQSQRDFGWDQPILRPSGTFSKRTSSASSVISTFSRLGSSASNFYK